MSGLKKLLKSYPSSSNPNKEYEVLLNEATDGTGKMWLSCNCPSWCTSKAQAGKSPWERTCKHTEQIRYDAPSAWAKAKNGGEPTYLAGKAVIEKAMPKPKTVDDALDALKWAVVSAPKSPKVMILPDNGTASNTQATKTASTTSGYLRWSDQQEIDWLEGRRETVCRVKQVGKWSTHRLSLTAALAALKPPVQRMELPHFGEDVAFVTGEQLRKWALARLQALMPGSQAIVLVNAADDDDGERFDRIEL